MVETEVLHRLIRERLEGGRALRLFRSILRGKVVIVGVGNPLRGDDGFGPALIAKLEDRQRARGPGPQRAASPAICIDAGLALENHLGRILKQEPDTVLFADAVDLQAPPGAFELLGLEETLPGGFSTHDFSPGIFFELFRESLRGELLLLGVQPRQTTLGAGLSPEVRRRVGLLAGAIVAALQEGRAERRPADWGKEWKSRLPCWRS